MTHIVCLALYFDIYKRLILEKFAKFLGNLTACCLGFKEKKASYSSFPKDVHQTEIFPMRL